LLYIRANEQIIVQFPMNVEREGLYYNAKFEICKIHLLKSRKYLSGKRLLFPDRRHEQ